MKTRLPFLLLAAAFLSTCSVHRAPVDSPNGADVEIPVIVRVFSHFEGELLAPLSAPIAGTEVRVLVAGLGARSEVTAHFADGEPWEKGSEVIEVSAELEESPVGLHSETQVVRFEIPEGMPAGDKYLQISAGSRRTYWTPFDVARPEHVEIRSELSRQARAALIEAHGAEAAAELTLVGRYRPLDVGTVLTDVTSGDAEAFTVAEPNTWAFFAFDRTAGFSQPYGTWLICFYPPRDVVTLFPRGPIGVVGGGLAQRDVLRGGAFDAGGDPEPPPAGGGGTTTRPRDQSGRLTGFSGRITQPCPNGRRSAVVILQLVQGEGDANGGVDEDGNPRLRPDFDALANSIRDSLGPHLNLGTQANPGPDRIDHLKPEDFLPEPKPTGFGRDRVKLDLDKKLKPLLEAIIAADGGACCTDITIVIISHGERTGAADEHPLSYYYRDPATGLVYKGNTGNRNRWNSTSDILTWIAETMGDSCIPVTVVDHSCYSGRTTDGEGRKFKDALTGHPDHKISLVAASGAGQTANGHEDGAGREQVFFFDALWECLRDLSNDASGDGFVSLKEGMACVQRKANDLSKRPKASGGSGKDQNPQLWPPLVQW